MSKKPQRRPAAKPQRSDTENRLRLERARIKSVKRLARTVEREARGVARLVERADRAQLMLARLIADRQDHAVIARSSLAPEPATV